MNYHKQTDLLHHDRNMKVEHGSVHKPIHPCVAYDYQTAEELVSVFQNKQEGFSYGRQSNPTINNFANKLANLENGTNAILFSTGMAAIVSTMVSLLKKGDHLIASQYLFGNTNSLFQTLSRIGIEVSFVGATEASNVEKAIKPNTKMVFVETIANPVTQVADLKNISTICQKQNLLYVVDNTITTPVFFKPKDIGAHLIIHSLTKYMGGHANALGGVVIDTGLFDWAGYSNILDIYRRFPTEKHGITQIRKKGLRDMGASLSPFDAHLLSVGMETLFLRVQQSTATANKLAKVLHESKYVKEVYYPGLENHPQHKRAKSLFSGMSGLFSFSLKSSDLLYPFLNQLKLVVKSSNLGDNRTLVMPVAQTIYYEMGEEKRKTMGIDESLIRVSVGIENTEDIINDFVSSLEICL